MIHNDYIYIYIYIYIYETKEFKCLQLRDLYLRTYGHIPTEMKRDEENSKRAYKEK
jgi:hypothetical protein